MGSLFNLIADSTLGDFVESSNATCPACARIAEHLYAVEFKVAVTQRVVRAACAKCLLDKDSGSVVPQELPAFFLDTVMRYARRTAAVTGETPSAIRDRVANLLSRTPFPPMAQGVDWPLCCGEPSVYIGSPDEAGLVEDTRHASFWDQGPAEKDETVDFAQCGPPEFQTDVLLFECAKCGKRHFTFQPT